MKTANTNPSVWSEKKLKSFAPLDRDRDCDVAIVGAGITGITAAYLLSRAGKKIILIEKNDLAAGDTRFTTAHLTAMIDPGYAELEKKYGEKKTKLIYQCHTRAIDFIDETSVAQGINCDFHRTGGYLFDGREQDPDRLDREFRAMQRAGAEVWWQAKTPLPLAQARPGILLSDQARFHPLKYLEGLVKAVLAQDGEIYTGTSLEKVTREGIKTENGYTIQCKQIVLATHVPIGVEKLLFVKQAAYRSYVIAYRVPKNSLPDALYWDTEDPYHYVRLQPASEDEDWVIVGGEDHKTGQAEAQDYRKAFENLEDWAQRNLSMRQAPEYRWSGQIMEPADSLAYIGKIRSLGSDVYIATGFSGNGMTYGTFAALLIKDLILGVKNPAAKLFRPSRTNLRYAGTFIQENFNVAKKLVAGWTAKKEISSPEQLRPGQGAVISKGVRKIAAYRTPSGELCQFSAVCTHLKCIVSWNHAEKTFDCPCHGSRFSTSGEVIQGPAIESLKSLDQERKAAKAA